MKDLVFPEDKEVERKRALAKVYSLLIKIADDEESLGKNESRTLKTKYPTKGSIIRLGERNARRVVKRQRSSKNKRLSPRIYKAPNP